MNGDEEELTPEEEKVLKEIEGSYDYPQAEEKQNIYNYFKKVITMRDNTKTANLTNEELGLAKIPVRTNQEIALLCEALGMGNISEGDKEGRGFAGYFQREAQILLGTSLSREGFLNKLAVTQKRELDTTKTKRPLVKKGWFAKKEKEKYEMQGG